MARPAPVRARFRCSLPRRPGSSRWSAPGSRGACPGPGGRYGGPGGGGAPQHGRPRHSPSPVAWQSKGDVEDAPVPLAIHVPIAPPEPPPFYTPCPARSLSVPFSALPTGMTHPFAGASGSTEAQIHLRLWAADCVGSFALVAPLPLGRPPASGTPRLQGAQPMPSHCPPDAKCQPQRHL